MQMDLLLIVDRIFITICVFNCLLSIVCLIIAIVYKKNCLDFATLLVCNTIIGIFIASTNMIAISTHIFIWDQQFNLEVDSFCEFRGYLIHSSMAYIHYSFVVIAVEKYLAIKRVNFFKTQLRKICVILVHWVFVFSLPLPMFLTGNVVKFSMDYLCIITFSRIYLLAIFYTRYNSRTIVSQFSEIRT